MSYDFSDTHKVHIQVRANKHLTRPVAPQIRKYSDKTGLNENVGELSSRERSCSNVRD